MLSPGLAASWKAGLRLGLTSLPFTASASARSRCATSLALALSRSSIGASNPSHRPLTTSSNILARLAPLSRRRDPLARSPPSLSPDLESTHPHHPPSSSAQQPSIPRALLFLLALSTLTFTSAAYYSLLDTQRIASRLSTSRDVFSNISSYFIANDGTSRSIWGPGVDERRLAVAKNQDTAERLGLRMEWIMRHCEQVLPEPVCEFVGRTYLIVAEKYLNLSPSQKVVVPVVAVNTVVFAMWSVASVGRRGGEGMLGWMTRNFVHRPSANRTRTLVTSVFSHQNFLHFTFNNLALWSIGGSALYLSTHLIPSAVGEASPTPHFLAFFSTAGVFAATVSHIVTAIRFKRISAIHGLQHAKETLGRHASLGASGAVYSALVMSAFAFPDAKLGVILLPWVTVDIGVGVVGLVLMDAVGVWRGWRMFDHWAHLAGAAFGAGYWFAGAEVWDRLKRWLVERMRKGRELE
ncbi:putative Rhomboid protein 1, mitochondrial (putative) [Pseudozyma hubeiensis]|nr:putative Rhomboid protein 1, mitochondrial (putative) [Pseudozyma hubeiensis]